MLERGAGAAMAEKAKERKGERPRHRPASTDKARLTALARALERLAAGVEALSLPWLDRAACGSYLDEAARLTYREARPVVGAGEKAVRQDFEVCFEDLGDDGPFHAFARTLEEEVKQAAALLPAYPLPPGFRFNDLIVQRYRPGSAGITPHVDHIRYQGLVAIAVFSGEGDFQIVEDREGRNPRSIPNAAGDLLLMRAPGFAGLNGRPFHRLASVRSPRVILGLRWDSRAGGTASGRRP
jgi:alkylated DNA repair dioxygenase AlkB